MESGRLKLVISGLILGAIALAYLIFSQKFAATKVENTQGSNTPVAQLGIDGASPAPVPQLQANGLSTQSSTTTLPKTGFPVGLMGVFSLSAIVTGWSLRRFPK